MKIGSLALKGTFAAMLALTALRWMVPAPEPAAQRQRQVGVPSLDEAAPYVAERTFYLPVTEPSMQNAGEAEDGPSGRSGQSRANPQQIH